MVLPEIRQFLIQTFNLHLQVSSGQGQLIKDSTKAINISLNTLTKSHFILKSKKKSNIEHRTRSVALPVTTGFLFNETHQIQRHLHNRHIGAYLALQISIFLLSIFSYRRKFTHTRSHLFLHMKYIHTSHHLGTDFLCWSYS